MVYQPVPLQQTATTSPNTIFAPVPVDYDGTPAPPVDPAVAALILAGFGTAGQVLATNSSGDGFEWIDPA